MGPPQGVRGRPILMQRMAESTPENSMIRCRLLGLGASLRLSTEFPVLYLIYIVSSRWPLKRQASVSNNSTSTAHRLAEPTHVLCKEAMFPLLAGTERTCLATPEGMFGIVPSRSKQPLLDNFMYEESIPSRRPASSPRRFDVHHLRDTRNLLTSHRFVERRWTGAMCLNRVARRASFSQA